MNTVPTIAVTVLGAIRRRVEKDVIKFNEATCPAAKHPEATIMIVIRDE